MKLSRWRVGYFVLFLACAGIIGFALYHQFYNWLMPCLFCVYERMAIIGVGLVAMLAVVREPQSRFGVWLISLLSGGFSLFGLITGVRHVWLQFAPKEMTANCPSTLPFPIDLNQLPANVAAVIRPVGDCSAQDFTLFGVSMPVWIVLACASLLLAMVWLARSQMVEIKRNQWR